MRIGLRILLGYFVIVALAAILLGRVFVQEVKPGVRQAMEDTLVDTANLLAAQARDDLLAGNIDSGRFAASVRSVTERDLGAQIWGFGKRRIGMRIYVTDDRGIVVYDSAGLDVGKDYSQWNDVYLTLRGRYGARSTRADPNDENSTVMHVAAPIIDSSSGTPRIAGVLTVAKPNQTMAPFIERSQGVIQRWGLLLLGVALLIGMLAAWWLSRQLDELRRYAVAVTAGEPVSAPDAPGEFGDLGRALDTMRERLEGKQYVEQYVHALTHELKSPLAAIRGSAELVEAGGHDMTEQDRAQFLGTIRAQGDRLAEMVDKLLALASVEHLRRIEQPVSVDIDATIREAVDRVTPAATRRGIVIARSGAVGTVSGDPFLLRQSVVNLLDNALAFAPTGSTVEVDVRCTDRRWTITVADRGPGIPDYAVERVFERFYSLPRPGGGSRSSGLGLSFVAQVANLHGGRATLANRPGGGAVATLELAA